MSDEKQRYIHQQEEDRELERLSSSRQKHFLQESSELVAPWKEAVQTKSSHNILTSVIMVANQVHEIRHANKYALAWNISQLFFSRK